jgi:hypothetical protein
MRLLCFVLAAHLIGDWIVQTDWQAANKADSWWAMFNHMAGYHLTLGIALLVGDINATGWWKGLAILGISWATHSVIDRRWPVVWIMRHTRSEGFSELPWARMVVDQVLHLSILLIAVGVIA